MTEPVPLLALDAVSHRFGESVALSDATLHVRAGQVHALLGENGAGKTTLMRVAYGLVTPDAGSIRIAGHQRVLRTPADAIAHGIGMVHQHFTLIPAMTVAENVALGGRGRFSRRETGDAVRALGKASGLAVAPDMLAGTLTVAQQQRVEILKALHRNVRALILDEPTAVLAPPEVDELLRWLRGYVEGGNAAVLITHKLHEALAVADEVTVLRHGAVVAQMPVAHATADTLTRAMLGDGSPSVNQIPPHANPLGSEPPKGIVTAVDVSAVMGRERIDRASFVLREREVTGVAGLEGAGHHLLLRLLAQRITPVSGALELPADIGFVPEDRHRDGIIVEYSLAENVALRGAGERRGRMAWDAWRSMTDDLLVAHDVRGASATRARTRMGALSGGNQQRLVVARELASEPRLIVAENPTRGLDVRAAAAVRSRLRAAAGAGAAVVVYSSDLDEVIAMADRVLVVHDGRVRECPRDRASVGRAMLGMP